MEDAIARALHGDHSAFTALYDRFAPAALRLAAGITRSPDLAQDAVQEAFLRVFQKGWQCRERFEPWFFRIVINESRRALRRRPRSEPLDPALALPSFTEGSDLSLTLKAALDRLSPEHRAVLVLKFLLDYSEQEIGEILRIPVGTVKSRVHYAKKALARELEEKEEPQYDRP